jgi:hypothetical protein
VGSEASRQNAAAGFRSLGAFKNEEALNYKQAYVFLLLSPATG